MLELKETITKKRIDRGLTPERIKFKDSRKLRRQIKIARSRLWLSINSTPPHEPDYKYLVSSNGIPISNKNGKHYTSSWKKTFVDGKMPHKNGQLLQQATGYIAKSSRGYMRMQQDWWNEGWEALAA